MALRIHYFLFCLLACLKTCEVKRRNAARGFGRQPDVTRLDALRSFTWEVVNRTNGGDTPLIVGGRESISGAWPWHAGIRYDGFVFCGGALIAENKVLTAAHCVQPFREYELLVVLGDNDLRSISGEEQIIVVKHIFVHKLYNADGLGVMDLAMLTLDENARRTRTVEPISLPSQRSILYEGETECYATGFGRISGDGPTSEVLREAKMSVITNQECQRVFLNQFDSGGPVACNVDGVWTLVGITSWGPIDCGDYPSVNMRVSYFQIYIRKALRIQ